MQSIKKTQKINSLWSFGKDYLTFNREVEHDDNMPCMNCANGSYT